MRLIDADDLIERIKEQYRPQDNNAVVNEVVGDIIHNLIKEAPNVSVMKFKVIDTTTGNYPDLEKIALTEEWAKDLMYCDMEGFAIEEDGDLMLMDECGNFRYCPDDRFKIEFEGI